MVLEISIPPGIAREGPRDADFLSMSSPSSGATRIGFESIGEPEVAHPGGWPDQFLPGG